MPQSTSAEAIEHVVSYAEEFHQTIKVRARAGHAAHLIIELSEYSVPVGSKPPPILVKFTDALNNVVEDINDFLPLLHLEADGLDVSQLVPKKTILPKEKSVRPWSLYYIRVHRHLYSCTVHMRIHIYPYCLLSNVACNLVEWVPVRREEVLHEDCCGSL